MEDSRQADQLELGFKQLLLGRLKVDQDIQRRLAFPICAKVLPAFQWSSGHQVDVDSGIASGKVCPRADRFFASDRRTDFSFQPRDGAASSLEGTSKSSTAAILAVDAQISCVAWESVSIRLLAPETNA